MVSCLLVPATRLLGEHMASFYIHIHSCDNITDGVDGGEAQAARAPHQLAALQEPEAVIEPLDRESRRYSEVEANK